MFSLLRGAETGLRLWLAFVTEAVFNLFPTETEEHLGLFGRSRPRPAQWSWGRQLLTPGHSLAGGHPGGLLSIHRVHPPQPVLVYLVDLRLPGNPGWGFGFVEGGKKVQDQICLLQIPRVRLSEALTGTLLDWGFHFTTEICLLDVDISSGVMR